MKRYLVSITLFTAIVTFCFSPDISAQMRKGAFSLSPSIGGYAFDSGQDVDDDIAYGLGLGHDFTENWTAEASFNYINSESKTTGNDVDAFLYRLDGLYHFMPEKKLVPYLAAGIGALRIDGDANEEGTDPLLNYGAGIKYFIKESLAIRGDIRHIITDDDVDNVIYTLGVNFLFGGEKPVVAAAIPEPSDSDGDGVVDDMDKCPGTPKGTAVDSDGCPLDSDGDGVYDYKDKCPDTPKGAAVNADGCPKDSDGDGVADYKDKCLNTPPGATVNSNGCPLDSDGDGVYDYLDKCPGTRRGIEVDKVGCPVPITEELTIKLHVEFDFDKASIRFAYRDHLEKVANFLKTYNNNIAIIKGHTDNLGSDDYNLNLSIRRAENVKAYLVGHFGVPPERIKAEGYGETMPIADNSTEEGQQKNRRVEAVITTTVTR